MGTGRVLVIQSAIFASLNLVVFVKAIAKRLHSKLEKYFIYYALAALLLELTAVFANAVDYGIWTPPNAVFMNVNYILMMLAFTVCGYCWFECFLMNLPDFKDSQIGFRITHFVPIVVMAVASIASPWTGWVFRLDENLVYHRGSLFILQILCPYIYIICGLVLVVIELFKGRRRTISVAIRNFICFVIPTVLGLLIQMFIQFGSYSQIGASVGMFLMYLDLYVEELKEKERLQSLADINDQLMQANEVKESQIEEIEELNDALLKRVSIIQSMSKVYFSSFSVDLATNTYEELSNIDEVRGEISDKPNAQEALFSICDKMVTPETADRLREFVNLSTVNERLRDKDFVTCDYNGYVAGWAQLYLIAGDRDEQGNLKTLFITSRTIHEEKQREEEQNRSLADALEAAQHANRAKTIFLNNISHDIRTPMNAIIGFTALAGSHIDNREAVLGYLNKINISSQHLLSLINDVLDMSRIESGKVRIEENDVHLPEVLHDIRTIIQSGIAAKQIELFVDTQDVVHEDIVTDKLRLNQVLLNILSNAMKFTPTGGSISVRIIEKASNSSTYGNYEFRVRDSGIGMSEEFIGHIFESFSREKSATVSGIQGTGLGMAITKNIVDMMGGTINVYSEKGKGSEFVVNMQFKLSENSPETVDVSRFKGMRALVADDDLNTCTGVTKMLETIGMRSEWTTSGREAVFRAKFALEQNDEFQAYIIDWLMPDMNGVEVVRRIRKEIGDSKPIIILTAYDWSDIEEEAREAGVTGFCSKPLFMSELRNVLAAPFGRKEAENPEEKYDFGGKRLLLTEDNELNREIAVAILEEAGFRVDVAGDGTEALQRMQVIEAGYYAAILMDIQMPVMDGNEATRAIRALPDPAKNSIPIIAMTANAFEEDREKALASGMNDYLAKPFKIDELMHTLSKYL